MAEFEVRVHRISIEEHPDADAIELARVGDYLSVVRKGQFETGDLAAYIPEAALVPENVLRQLQLWDDEKGKGRLAGSKGDRVKPLRLRGVLSEGLVHPARAAWKEGDEVSSELGIVKYEPPIPTVLQGEVGSSAIRFTFDIENYKRYPGVLEDDEEVVFTEKIHGTFTAVGLVPVNERRSDMLDGRYYVSSKGMASQGFYLRDNDVNARNTYLRAARDHAVGPGLEKEYGEVDRTIWLVGETFGMQKNKVRYTYGAGEGKHGFAAFGIKVGHEYLDEDEFQAVCARADIPTVPTLYRGPFSRSKMAEYTDGRETVSGKEMHIREGIVIRPVIERYDPRLGRVILKNLSEAYLLKMDGSEFN